MILTTAVIIFAVCMVLCFLSTRKDNKNNGIPTISLTMMLSMMIRIKFNGRMDGTKFSAEVLAFMQGADNLFRKEGIVSADWGLRYVHLFHHSTVEPILNSNVTIKKGLIYRLLLPWLGTGLLTSTGTKWKRMRKLLTPAFHLHILEDFMTIFNEQSKILARKMEGFCNDAWTDVLPQISLCTFDIIGESAMGVSFGAQSKMNSEYVNAVKRIADILLCRGLKPWLWIPFVFHLSADGREMQKCLKIIHDFDRKIISKRKQKLMDELRDNKQLDDFESADRQMGIKKRRTFLDLLLYNHLTFGNISEEEIREEVDTFMFEGHDTTAAGVSWTLYLLGHHPQIQNKVYQELCSIFGDDKYRDITMEDLRSMKYLECVIKESLRLFPPVPMILRSHPEDLQIGRHKVKANTDLVVFIFELHRDPEIFPNPEVFDPDRFLTENSTDRHPFSYIPFSAGPRNCIGQRFAMMEEKVILANILRKFTFRSIDQRDKLSICASMVLRPENGIRLAIRNRSEK